MFSTGTELLHDLTQRLWDERSVSGWPKAANNLVGRLANTVPNQKKARRRESPGLADNQPMVHREACHPHLMSQKYK
jgi:hypothetical protein